MKTTLAGRCEELAKLHGGLRKAATACDIDVGYFSRLKSGDKNNPTDETLRKLGLTRVITYKPTSQEGTTP